MQERIFLTSIKGASPLMMNRFIDSSENKQVKKEYDSKQEAEKRLYISPDGEIYQPAEHIERAMQKASVNFKYSGRKTYVDFLKSSVFIRPDYIPHKHQKWEIDKRPVNVQRNKIMRSRPLFKKWELEFEIQVINDNISESTLHDILQYARQFCWHW